ncbi:MAG: hypothetical protein IPK85_07080 [Gemmatimonadetes bacterium]|nr:hypothetical protein [Gemmatimonadota bacterium]
MRRRHTLFPVALLGAFLTGCCDVATLCGESESEALVTGLRLTADSLAVRVAPTTSGIITLSLTSSEPTAHTLQLLQPNGDITAKLGTTSLVPGGTTSLQVSALSTATPTSRALLQVVASLRNAADTLTITTEVIPPFTLGVSGTFTDTAGSRFTGTATMDRVPGFTDPVSLAITGLPAGWVVTLPSRATTSVVPFTLASPPNANPGLYLVQLTATYGATTIQRQFTLRITQNLPPPDIALSLQPAGLSVEQGQGGSYLVSIARTAPGIGLATMGVTGLPAGAAGAFTPAAANDTTRLAITTLATTPPGTYTLTVTGVAGTISRQATATLTVTAAPPPPSLALSVAPTALTVAQGATGQAAVTITRANGAGNPTLDLQGLPAGVTAAFLPPVSPTAATPLVLSVGAAVVPGTYALTVRGVAGALTATAPLSLTVTAPTSNFTLQLPPTITIRTGETALIPVTISRTGGFVGVQIQVGINSIPLGGNAWVGPTTTRGDTTTLQVIGGIPGTHLVSIIASGGSLIRTAAMQVIVVASTTPDFALVPQAKELTVPRGQFVPAVLLINNYNGFNGPITLSAITDTPGNYVVDFTPSVPAGFSSVNVQIYASPNIAPGPHLIVYRGVSNGVERRAVLTIFVQ